MADQDVAADSRRLPKFPGNFGIVSVRYHNVPEYLTKCLRRS